MGWVGSELPRWHSGKAPGSVGDKRFPVPGEEDPLEEHGNPLSVLAGDPIRTRGSQEMGRAEHTPTTPPTHTHWLFQPSPRTYHKPARQALGS